MVRNHRLRLKPSAEFGIQDVSTNRDFHPYFVADGAVEYDLLHRGLAEVGGFEDLEGLNRHGAVRVEEPIVPHAAQQGIVLQAVKFRRLFFIIRYWPEVSTPPHAQVVRR